MVNVTFSQAWAIYLKYAMLRFFGLSTTDIIAGGNFLNYDITWNDAEKIFLELSKDASVIQEMKDLEQSRATVMKEAHAIISAI